MTLLLFIACLHSPNLQRCAARCERAGLEFDEVPAIFGPRRVLFPCACKGATP